MKKEERGILEKSFYRIVKTILIAGIILLMINHTTSYVSATDEDHDTIDDEQENILAQKYAPILYFEKEEEVYPVAIEYHLSNANLNQSTDAGPIIIDTNPSIQEISTYTNPEAKYYLDNKKGTINDAGIIRDYQMQEDVLGHTLYCHVMPDIQDGESVTVVQYWMFYAFNKGPLNTHEGDWEMVQVILNAIDEPVEAMYSQHIDGQKAKWSQVEKEDDHIKVYVARGSHANYLRSYQGKLGLASDTVGKNGITLKPEDYSLILLGETGEGSHPPEQNWVDFAGRWGDFGGEEDELRGKRGPYGPAYRENGEMWHNPIAWGDSLASTAKEILLLNWFIYHFVIIFLVFLIISLAVTSFLIYKRYKDVGLGSRISSLFYIDGINKKSIGNILCITGIVIAVFSLFFPWYTVSSDIQIGAFKTSGMTKLIEIDGLNGIQVNLLESNSGLIQLGALPIPFSFVLGAGILLFVLGTIGIAQSRIAGKKYISRGIKFIVPFVLIIIVVIALTTFAFQLATNIDIPQDMKEILKEISASPFGNEKTLYLPEYGTTHLEWGIGIGAIFLLIAGIIFLIAGILEASANQPFFEGSKS